MASAELCAVSMNDSSWSTGFSSLRHSYGRTDAVRFQWSGRRCPDHRHQGLPVREGPVRVFIGCSKLKGKLPCNIN